MADDAGQSDEYVTFNVKSSSDAKYTLTLPRSTTVADLKGKLATSEYADTPAERQRLIYSGRVLKDHDTLETTKIKDGNTVHLVKSAASNARQNPAAQGSSATPSGAGTPRSNVPTSFATGTGNDPLAGLTGARYAGMMGLPGAGTFGPDGGMGAPPDPDQLLRQLEDPNTLQLMTEAMNNPIVIQQIRNSPMFRNNPMMQQMFDNPAFRRMLTDPEVIRQQMQMARSFGGVGGPGGGNSAFPAPGVTNTTPQGSPMPGQNQEGQDANAANPFGNLFGGAGAGAAPGGTGSPFQAAAQNMMQNPEAMRAAMQMLGLAPPGAGGEGNTPGAAGGDANAAANPFAGLFGPAGAGGFPPAGPPDTRPPEERYADQLRQLNDMGFYEFERNIQALRRSGGSVQGAVEYLLNSS
ncbi:Ubiquitin-associated/translation elongation factor EF1B [Neofusicoccum parvum]|uniref:Ubiquitin-associated/translation elongation factor EF1B n=2 Tax=Neofusicoccum parvum TaxID=310453 RepID=A0ACB5RRZ8_9PEZI|nr:putative ubiquitin-like protein [Neofusicoccum parvum UCRNP2]GME23292.1 Ubiquitin-associated/translation elongation factor EF1B [Neofusicoccum parvum]GME36721.1 Ubiquitin-associated/translation elongation factor EF1B [Neofusicoccum parvum]